MTPTEPRTRLHKATGLIALLLFAVFMGNIVLAKLGTMSGFAAPRLSPQSEFLTMLGATLLAVIYLLHEEKWKARRGSGDVGTSAEIQAEEERP